MNVQGFGSLAARGAVSIVISVAAVFAQPVSAQTVPRSFEASPDIYRELAQGDQFRVIEVTWKPGQRDVMHAHPASAVYYLTDCSLRSTLADGTSREARRIHATALVQPPIAGHTVENIGQSDCRLVMFEPR